MMYAKYIPYSTYSCSVSRSEYRINVAVNYITNVTEGDPHSMKLYRFDKNSFIINDYNIVVFLNSADIYGNKLGSIYEGDVFELILHSKGGNDFVTQQYTGNYIMLEYETNINAVEFHFNSSIDAVAVSNLCILRTNIYGSVYNYER